MTLHAAQRFIFDTLRSLETEGRAQPDPGTYELAVSERRHLETRDIAALYRAGVHPVLLQQYGRATGMSTADLQDVLRGIKLDTSRTARWHTCP